MDYRNYLDGLKNPLGTDKKRGALMLFLVIPFFMAMDLFYCLLYLADHAASSYVRIDPFQRAFFHLSIDMWIGFLAFVFALVFILGTLEVSAFIFSPVDQCPKR